MNNNLTRAVRNVFGGTVSGNDGTASDGVTWTKRLTIVTRSQGTGTVTWADRVAKTNSGEDLATEEFTRGVSTSGNSASLRNASVVGTHSSFNCSIGRGTVSTSANLRLGHNKGVRATASRAVQWTSTGRPRAPGTFAIGWTGSQGRSVTTEKIWINSTILKRTSFTSIGQRSNNVVGSSLGLGSTVTVGPLAPFTNTRGWAVDDTGTRIRVTRHCDGGIRWVNTRNTIKLSNDDLGTSRSSSSTSTGNGTWTVGRPFGPNAVDWAGSSVT